jgi:hypothetical protein
MKELLDALFTVATSSGRFGLSRLCRPRTRSEGNYDLYPGDNDHVRHTSRHTVWCPNTIYDDICHTGSRPVCCPGAILDNNLHNRSLCTTDADHYDGSPLILIAPPRGSMTHFAEYSMENRQC